MKYFTGEYLADWERVRPDDETHLAYAQSIACIRAKLPPNLQRLCDLTPGWTEDKIFLNDSNVREIDCSLTDKRVTIILGGEYTNAAGHQLGLRDFCLRYQQVTNFLCTGTRLMSTGMGRTGSAIISSTKSNLLRMAYSNTGCCFRAAWSWR